MIKDMRVTHKTKLLQPFLQPFLMVMAVALVGLLLPSAAIAQSQFQDRSALFDRIDRLERDLQTLQVRLFREQDRKEKAAAERSARVAAMEDEDLPLGAGARLNVRISSLEEEVRDLTGQVEQVDFQLRQLGSRLDRLVGDIDQRLLALEQGGAVQVPAAQAPQQEGQATNRAAASSNALPSQAPNQKGGPGDRNLYEMSAQNRQFLAPPADSGNEGDASGPANLTNVPRSPAGVPLGTPAAQYDYAFNLLQASEFNQAQKALQEFLDNHENHELASNAQYWLAETYYVQENYQRAAVEFLKGYQNYPKSPKETDNLLKLALSLARLGNKQEACTTLDKLAREHPTAPVNIKRRGAAEWDRLKCSV